MSLYIAVPSAASDAIQEHGYKPEYVPTWITTYIPASRSQEAALFAFRCNWGASTKAAIFRVVGEPPGLRCKSMTNGGFHLRTCCNPMIPAANLVLCSVIDGTSTDDLPRSQPQEGSAANAAFEVISVTHLDGQVLAVRCNDEKHSLAQQYANIAASAVGSQAVAWDVRLSDDQYQHLTEQISYHGWLFPRIASVVTGRFSGLIAIGAGTNKNKGKRGAAVALSLQAMLQEGEVAPPWNLSPGDAAMLADLYSTAMRLITRPSPPRRSLPSGPLQPGSSVHSPAMSSMDTIPSQHTRWAPSPRSDRPSVEPLSRAQPTQAPRRGRSPQQAEQVAQPPPQISPRTPSPRRRGRTRHRQHLVEDEVDGFIFFADSLHALQRDIDDAKAGRRSWNDSVWASLQKARAALPLCPECREDNADVARALECLSDAWWNAGTWDEALAKTEAGIHSRLAAPEPGGITMPIEDIHYTQNEASAVFTHGDHAGMEVICIADDLVANRISSTAPQMTLDIVFYHGRYYSFNNRHLKALRMLLAHIEPEWKRREQEARVRVWPLSHELRLPHQRIDIITKLSISYSTRDRSRTLSLRPQTSSRSSSSRSTSRRRVTFIGPDTNT